MGTDVAQCIIKGHLHYLMHTCKCYYHRLKMHHHWKTPAQCPQRSEAVVTNENLAYGEVGPSIISPDYEEAFCMTENTVYSKAQVQC